MAEQNVTTLALFDAEKLEPVEKLLHDLKEKAREASDDGDLYLLSVYNRLIQVTSPLVVRAHARIERDARAVSNRAEKALRKREREARQHAQNNDEQ